jgi:hypothetical protein
MFNDAHERVRENFRKIGEEIYAQNIRKNAACDLVGSSGISQSERVNVPMYTIQTGYIYPN